MGSFGARGAIGAGLLAFFLQTSSFPSKPFFQRGVNFTAEYPAVYSSEAARTMLAQLPGYGINAIALVPYGWTRTDPPRVRLPRAGRSWESDAGIESLAGEAHRLGMKVLLKPHLGGRFRLRLDSEPERAAWFAEYEAFIAHYAQLAARIRADLFCIGAELSAATGYTEEWRRLIARIREIYPGPLVYAANWGSEFEGIAFWDALDYIGLDNYYPLPDDLTTDAVMEKIAAVQQRFNRPVIFTEAGFASVESPHRQPWAEESGAVALEEQARCYEALLRAFWSKPWFQGVYWWKVGTNGFGGPLDRSHTPWGKPAMEVLKRWYVNSSR